MNLSSINQQLQYISWLVALIGLIAALYVVILNPRQSTNRYISLFEFTLSVLLFTLGSIFAAQNFQQARLPAIILTIALPMIMPLLLICSLALIKPEWLYVKSPIKLGKFSVTPIRWHWWPFYLLIIAPAIVTSYYLYSGKQLWFEGLYNSTLKLEFFRFLNFRFSQFENTLSSIGYIVSELTLLAILIIILFPIEDHQRRLNLPVSNKRTAWLILTALTLISLVQFMFRDSQSSITQLLVCCFILTGFICIAVFQQLFLGQRVLTGSLQTRLVTLLLAITLPVLAAVAILVTNQAKWLLESDAKQNLARSNQVLTTFVTVWLDYNVRALQEMVKTPGILEINSDGKEKLLKSLISTYPHIYFAGLVDLDGRYVTQSEDQPPNSVADSAWFKLARQGVPISYQIGEGRNPGETGLIVAIPVLSETNSVIGVATYKSDIDAIKNQTRSIQYIQGGVAYIVDEHNRILSNSDPDFAKNLDDLSEYPPIKEIRKGELRSNNFTFTDGQNRQWLTEFSILANNWLIIVQQPENTLLAPVNLYQRISWLILITGAFLIFVLAWLTIRQSLHPVETLTETAKAITKGEFDRVAPVESGDEIGILAQAFNQMTAQLRYLISDLESRVSLRTRDLEKRASQSQVTAVVAHEAASAASTLRNIPAFLTHTVSLISERFNYYHVGIFLLDSQGEFAVLQAASSEGGGKMLARGHQLKVGQVGIVGFVAGKGEPRIASDVGQDAEFFNNPDLPETHSEMALPLKVAGKVIGVLDVQSKEKVAFHENDVSIMQVLADQIALAIENARLLADSEKTLKALETIYQRQIIENWGQYIKRRNAMKYPLVYSYDRMGVQPEKYSQLVTANTQNDNFCLEVPIDLRGQRIGNICLYREKERGDWQAHEKDLVIKSAVQVSLALENVRLMDEIQHKATQEKWVNQVVSKTQETLDVKKVMEVAVQEIGRNLNVSTVRIRFDKNLGD